MPSGSAGKRYAQAVFELACSSEKLDEWAGDLASIQQVFEDPEVGYRLDNPKVHREDKLALINSVLKDKLSTQGYNLAVLLVERSRHRFAKAILNEYIRLLNDLRGEAIAEVTTAVPIGDDEEASIRQNLEKITGKKIIIEKKIDPTIIGGLVARVGDTLIDGSIRDRLQALRKALA